MHWRFPDGRSFTAVRAISDAQGHFKVDVEARPIAVSVDDVASTLEVDALTPWAASSPARL